MSELNLLHMNAAIPSGGRRVIYQLPKNPADKCTIVSVFPKEIIETKTAIFPSRFVIPAAEENDFSLTVVDGASYYQSSVIDRMPPTEVQINSAQLAESLVNDYVSSTWLALKGSRSPGIFWIPGAFDKKSILAYVHSDGRKFSEMLETARVNQKAWFTEVMNFADEAWARTNGNPRAIMEDARLAAKLLGVESTKPWMNNVVASQLEHCPSCGEMINMSFPVCKHCHAVINAAKAKELNLTFAKN